MGDHTNSRLPLWLRIAFIAEQRDGELLARGELRYHLDPTLTLRPTDVSRAIRTAVRLGLLHPQSSARVLYPKTKERV